MKKSYTISSNTENESCGSALNIRKQTAIISRGINLCDLPLDILEKIIQYSDVKDHIHIRGVCRCLRDVSNLAIMHDFRTALKYQKSLNPPNITGSVLKTIKIVTEAYISSGLENTFCGILLSVLKSNYKETNRRQLGLFVFHFFSLIDDEIGNVNHQQSVTLYNLTLIRLLKSFTGSCIIRRKYKPYKVAIKLMGAYLKTSWNSKPHVIEPKDLLIMLSKMLSADMTATAFRQCGETTYALHVFGNGQIVMESVPYTMFDFIISGSRKICSLFRSCVESNLENFNWPSNLPQDRYNFTFKIVCKDMLKSISSALTKEHED
uniref:F-box domain-containing protein n=1 Tax=Glossina palpalis gambiensis TaxID=67801 RepID=A0A1B0BEJ3_9MUSC